MEQSAYLVKFGATGLMRLVFPVAALVRHIHDHFIPHHRNNYHPHVFSRSATALFAAGLLMVKIFTVSVASFGPVLPAYSSAITSANIIALTNSSRAAYQLPLLAESLVLSRAAQAKAEDMLAKGYFSHNSPDGKKPWSFIAETGYNYLMAGENLAVNFSEAESVGQAWMNSPGHKANILNKNFEEIGVGIAQGEYQGHMAIFVVQMFGTPSEQNIKLSNRPTEVLSGDVPVPPAESVTAGQGQAKELVISEAKTEVGGGYARVTVRVEPEAVKVIAYYGEKAVMLAPKSGQAWEGLVPLSSLDRGDVVVRVRAYDIRGGSVQENLAAFTAGTKENFSVLGASTGIKVSFMGRVFDPEALEQRIYLLFISSILACLILAIAIKRHIQHLSLIANGSFTVILAALLWAAG